MNNFTLHNPTRIVFGADRIEELGTLIAPDARVFILYGGGSVERFGTLDEVKRALGERPTTTFSGIEPNPTYETCMRAVAQLRSEPVDFLLAVGGGSVIDATKFIAAAVNFAGDPWDLMHSAQVETALPFGVVLTLPATGSEMNCASVISRRETEDKLAFISDKVYPQFSILDPTKSYTLPPSQIANGVVDAFTHVMELYLTYPVRASVQDRWAEGLLLTLIEEGPKALANPEDYDVRANIMWAATCALCGMVGAGVPQDWSTHILGAELTVKYGLDHAVTLAIILPSMLDAMRAYKRDKLLQYAARVWGIDESKEGDEEARLDMAIAKTRAFFEQMGIQTRLAAHGGHADDIPFFLSQLERHGTTAIGEHGRVDLETAKRVYTASL